MTYLDIMENPQKYYSLKVVNIRRHYNDSNSIPNETRTYIPTQKCDLKRYEKDEVLNGTFDFAVNFDCISDKNYTL